jgi:hypothetical protein
MPTVKAEITLMIQYGMACMNMQLPTDEEMFDDQIEQVASTQIWPGMLTSLTMHRKVMVW